MTDPGWDFLQINSHAFWMGFSWNICCLRLDQQVPQSGTAAWENRILLGARQGPGAPWPCSSMRESKSLNFIQDGADFKSRPARPLTDFLPRDAQCKEETGYWLPQIPVCHNNHWWSEAVSVYSEITAVMQKQERFLTCYYFGKKCGTCRRKMLKYLQDSFV